MSKTSDQTRIGGSNQGFPDTEWTKVARAVDHEGFWSELYGRYWKPVYSYLRSMGFGNERAKDLVQGFFAEKVLGQELLRKADKTRGKFRNFLLISVRNYALKLQKRERMAAENQREIFEAPGGRDPERAFHRAWADEVLNKVLSELEEECRKKGKERHWALFREWLLQPEGDEGRGAMGQVCGRVGIEEAGQGYNMIANIKKRFRAILYRRLRVEVSSEEEIEKEIGQFIELFSRERAR